MTIVTATITVYADNGQTRACVCWSDGSRTVGCPRGAHMQALLARAHREGVEVTRDTAGWLPAVRS